MNTSCSVSPYLALRTVVDVTTHEGYCPSLSTAAVLSEAWRIADSSTRDFGSFQYDGRTRFVKDYAPSVYFTSHRGPVKHGQIRMGNRPSVTDYGESTQMIQHIQPTTHYEQKKSTDQKRFTEEKSTETLQIMRPYTISSRQYTSDNFQGTIRPSSTFEDMLTAMECRDTLRKYGDEKLKIFDILAHINNPQRQMLRTPYSLLVGGDLVEDMATVLPSETDGMMIALMETPTKYDILQVHQILQGYGTMETLAEILCSKQNDEMIALNNQYESEYGVTLKSAISEATKGRIRDLLTSVVDDQREKPIDVDNSKAQEDARRLLSRHDDEGRHIDQYVLYRLLSTCNKQQLIRTFKNYERMCNMDVESAIQKDCEGGERIVYLSLIQCTTNKPRFFAMRLNEALKTLKANTNELVRILISRSEIDLKLIQQEYYKLFGKDLTEEVASKTDGPHRSTLTAIVRGNYRGF